MWRVPSLKLVWGVVAFCYCLFDCCLGFFIYGDFLKLGGLQYPGIFIFCYIYLGYLLVEL